MRLVKLIFSSDSHGPWKKRVISTQTYQKNTERIKEGVFKLTPDFLGLTDNI